MTPLILISVVALTASLAVMVWPHRQLVRDGGRFAVALARHPDLPHLVRWLLALAVLPIPGPVDELAGGLAVLILLRTRPGLVTETWQQIRSSA